MPPLFRVFESSLHRVGQVDIPQLPTKFAQSHMTWSFLPAATKLGQGNILTGVCLSTGGGSASVHAGIYPPCLPQCMLGYTPPPPGSRLQHTVNERPVRILLECILVFFFLRQMICTMSYIFLTIAQFKPFSEFKQMYFSVFDKRIFY